MIKFLIYLAIFLFILWILRKFLNGPKTNLTHSMEGKTIIVTGANTGIGKVAALDLLKNGARVIFAGRDESKTLSVINSIENKFQKENAFFIKLDVSSFESIKNFADEFKNKFGNFDILINNAGATFDFFNLKENIEATMMTNHIGPVCLTALLLNNLNPKGRIINVSSRGHKRVSQKELDYLYAEENFGNIKSAYAFMTMYGLSKLGNIYHAKELTQIFKRNKMEMKAVSLHPGLVNTDIFNLNRFTKFWVKFGMVIINLLLYLVAKDVNMGAQTTLHIAYMDYEDLNSGAYYSNCSEEKIKEIACNEDKIREFKEFTTKCIFRSWRNVPKEVSEYFTL